MDSPDGFSTLEENGPIGVRIGSNSMGKRSSNPRVIMYDKLTNTCDVAITKPGCAEGPRQQGEGGQLRPDPYRYGLVHGES